MDQCYFTLVNKCRCAQSASLSTNGPARIQKIIECSRIYGDGLHEELEKMLENDTDCSIMTHRTYISCYVSPKTIQRLRKRKADSSISPEICSETKRVRRSSTLNFDFRQHCLFCGEPCEVVKDPKNPRRWRKAYMCRTVGETVNLKNDIIQKCALRGDDWAEQVEIRIRGALSDLHAADARYHVDCKAKFMTPKYVRLASKASSSSVYDENVDIAFETLCNGMQSQNLRIWNSVELFQIYTSEGGESLTRRRLLEFLKDRFGEEIIILSGIGIASIVLFRSHGSTLLNIVYNEKEDDDIDVSIKKVAKQINKECTEFEINRSIYQTRIDKETLQSFSSDTLMKMLSEVSKSLSHTPPAFHIASIVTEKVTNYATPLQVALGVLMRNSKALVSQMSNFGITCSYDEVLRFKKSAAAAAAANSDLQGISENGGLIQTVVDNFDADISSQNGKLSTHSLAMLVTQPSNESCPNEESQTIRRLSKPEMAEAIDYDIKVEHFDGPKKADMPVLSYGVPPLKILAERVISSNRAKSLDFIFLKDIVSNEKCPEFNGYNTKLSREQGHAKRQKTNAVYLPLIDKTPSDPDTIKTALKQAMYVSTKCNQEYTVFTADLQLYRVALNILWAEPKDYDTVVLRLGGMHTLMSFVGSIGRLREGSGLAEVLESTFGGVLKMLSGKKFPQNVRALRMLTEELLTDTLNKSNVESASDLEIELTRLSATSKTSKMWVDCLIKAVFIIMVYIRAERENDWCLHLTAISQIIPYFFAAGHVHYARYCLYYLRSMDSMPPKCFEKFVKGEHVMRHIPGAWNGIWSDMFIETTFMRYGHGKRGIIGITLKPDTLKIWSLSLHICSKLEGDISNLVCDDDNHSEHIHKEEMKGRIESDRVDRKSLQTMLTQCIHPLNPESHPREIVNIVSGQIAPDTVNVDMAIEIGNEQMRVFEAGWPGSFYDKISQKVKTLSEIRKSINIGEAKVFDTELIFSRVVGLQASSRDVNLKELLAYELSPIPTSMFSENGSMRIAKSKSALKQLLKVDVSARTETRDMHCVVIDGSAILYIIRWPVSGLIGDYITKYRHYIESKLIDKDVYVIFDRYREYSTKCATRESRAATTQRVHQLSATSQISNQKVIFAVPENKRQLIALIVADLCTNTSFPQSTSSTRRLIVTGEDEVPTEITQSSMIQRNDMRTSHEEADNIIAQQMVEIAKQNSDGILVISDDTDVFVLLLHHYIENNLKNKIVMESPVQDRSVIDITKTAEKYRDIIPDLLAAHALTGCDTTACLYGLGKGTMLKVLKSKAVSLSAIGDNSSSLSQVIQVATRFIGRCYSLTADTDAMSDVRRAVWANRIGKASACAPKLSSLPPTTESFSENVKRVHFQTCIWKHAVNQDPPNMDPCSYGWKKKDVTRSLVPIMLPQNVSVAPENVLKLIRCSCESQTPCSTLRCRCNASRLCCTVFCHCQGSDACCNEQKIE